MVSLNTYTPCIDMHFYNGTIAMLKNLSTIYINLVRGLSNLIENEALLQYMYITEQENSI